MLHHLILSNAVVKSTQSCIKATSRLGARLVVLKAYVVSLLDGVQPLMDTLLDPLPSCLTIHADWIQAQGAFKYGGYEYFKKLYSDLAGEEMAYRYKTWLYLAASASAEFIADVALCPFEAVKVRMQTTIPPFATSTFSGISVITAKEGTSG